MPRKKKAELREYLVPVRVEKLGHVHVLAESSDDAEESANDRGNWLYGFNATEMINWEVDGTAEENS